MSNAQNGGMLTPEASMIEMAPSGTLVDLLHPVPEVIHPTDIANHLSNISRYTGATSYSVAEHVVLVHDLLCWMDASEALCCGGVLHDGTEAYLGDLSSPLKWTLRYVEHYGHPTTDRSFREFTGAYGRITHAFDRAICRRFDLDPTLFDAPEVKLADLWALRIEAAVLLPSQGNGWRWDVELPNDGKLPDDVPWIGGLTPTRAMSVLNVRLRARGIA